MGETVQLAIVVLAALIIFPLLFRWAKKVDRFKARVKEYINTKHPEITIVEVFGFGFKLKIRDKIYPLWLHPLRSKYKKKPDQFDSIVENGLFELPFIKSGKEAPAAK